MSRRPGYYLSKEPRHYYAAYSPYGSNTILNNYNNPIIYVFRDAKSRDNWINEKPENREKVTRREADKHSKYYERIYAYPDGCFISWLDTTLKTADQNEIPIENWDKYITETNWYKNNIA